MKKSSEGNTYEVRWKKLPTSYSAWLKATPKSTVSGKDEEELSEKLFDIAIDNFGDGEPCFDFNPPLPVESEQQDYFEPAWYTLGCNEGFRTVGDQSKLYSSGLCSYCGAGRGERTSVPRVIDGIPKSDLAFLWSDRRGVYIVSDRFAKYFGSLLGRRMRKIACSSVDRTKKVFYELVLTPELPLVAHKDATDAPGTLCPSCKWQRASYFVCHSIAKGLLHAVEREKLTRLKRKATIAASMRAEICVNAQVAKQLKTKGELKGVLLHRLGLLNPKDIGKFKLVKPDKVQR